MKRTITIFLILLFDLAVVAQEKNSFFRPDHAKIQFAGNIGFLSAGVGYEIAQEKGEVDLMVGYLPESIGGVDIITANLKAGYYPWKINFSENYTYEPVYGGIYLSYSFGSEYYLTLPEHYPEGYYWWPTALRGGLYIGGRLSKDVALGEIDRLGLYYELGTYDLKLISVLQNLEYFSITDALDLAIGVRVKF
ncbi:MAG: hypothetical protein ACNS60_17110 [Candidatus Cyclobacteriaceae bacterium M2_1C_046]